MDPFFRSKPVTADDAPEMTKGDQPVILTWVTTHPGERTRHDSGHVSVARDHREIVMLPQETIDALGRRVVQIDAFLATRLGIPQGQYEHVSEDEETGIWIYRKQ